MSSNRTLHEPSSGYLQKRHSDHLSSSSIPGTRVYPYPGTTQEPVRNSYHHSGTHLSAIPHHLSSLYSIGTNSGHSAAVGPQTYREANYSVKQSIVSNQWCLLMIATIYRSIDMSSLPSIGIEIELNPMMSITRVESLIRVRTRLPVPVVTLNSL